MRKKTKRNLVIYFAGGTMTGVFGAGVATVFEKENLYPRIKAVYTASAGAMTGAYFLSRQTELGSSIYWENLDKNFIDTKDFFVGVWQRFENEFIKKVPSRSLKDALNIDYAMRVIKTHKKLDVKTILKQPVPLFVKVFDLDEFKIKYIDSCRPAILKILKIGINVFPYVHKLEKIDNHRYIDGGIIEIIGINNLLKKHPKDKIVIVINRSTQTKISNRAKNFLEGKFMEWMFNDTKLYSPHAQAEDNFKKDLNKIKKSANVILIHPPKKLSIKSRTTSAEALMAAHKEGIKAGKAAVLKLLK